MSDAQQTPAGSVLRKVELLTSDGRYVATVEILPYALGPDVVMWGSRIFMAAPQCQGPNARTIPSAFYECFATAAFTPSPGLERQPRCASFIEDGGYIRPCELAHEHPGACSYTVVTPENAGRLRKP